MEYKPTLLVVDDEERIRRLLRMYLEREEYQIEEASNGRRHLNSPLQKNMT